MKITSQNGSGTVAARGNRTSVQRSESEYLQGLGENIRAARARLGITRRILAARSGVSERFLAQLEAGRGNASVLILRQIAQGLELTLEDVLRGDDTASADFLSAVEFLRHLDASQLSEAREILLKHFPGERGGARSDRIALIGLRGAGKSSVGELLAQRLEIPFFELDRLIEQASGLSLSMIFDLYGQSGFRRFERRCLSDLLAAHGRFVVATGGSLVLEPATYERLRADCFTIWLRATPQDHMSRVVAQGDMRPMAHNPEAMSDLERILAQRERFYAQADVTVETSGRSVQQVLAECSDEMIKYRESTIEDLENAAEVTVSTAST
jgi:XRE family transcriptional regulator, aerobic/anaerobic benzoate catabolism transcriptional regulator